MNRIFIPGGKGGRGDLNYARSYPDFEIGDQLTLYQGAMSFADCHPYHPNLSIDDGLGVDGTRPETASHRAEAAKRNPMSKRLFKEFIERAENGGLVPIKPPNWWEEQPTDLSRRVYKTVDLLKIALEIGADSDPIRRLKQKYAPQDAIGSGVTDTHDEIAVLAAPAVSGKKTARKRRDEKRPEIERALEALESSPDWAKSSDKSRCRSVEQHLGKPEGWCSPRTLRRAIEGREKASRG